MSLREYHKKRKFDKTPEPEGKEKESTGPLTFVIQKHEASRLHYDFRLEINGVLKSWAVPKGPSLNPDDKRLAMMVEDHPMDYAGFEGIIPKGNYGAGTVMVWDHGVFHPLAFVDRKQAQVILTEQLKKGHLTFLMLGEKVQGEFALIKTHGREENAWLLVKANDEYASKKDVTLKDRSVVTKRSMDEIKGQAVKKQEVWYSTPKALDLSAIPESLFPDKTKPMLAQPVEEPFDDDAWVYEIKYDGYRAIAEIKDRNVALYSRNHIPYHQKFAPIATSLKKFPGDAVLDGEVVVVDADGKPNFQWLQEYPDEKHGELLYYVFDLLYYNGHDTTHLPLVQRKALLQQLLPPLPGIVYAEHIATTGIAMFQQTQQLGIEGIVAKKADSQYEKGTRSYNWRKIKTLHRQEVVIGGFTRPKGGRKYFGSLIAGVYKKDKLMYVGHIGGGFDEAQLERIAKILEPLIQKDCPFETTPETNAPATWVKPVLLAEASFSQWTRDGQMRHPLFIGLREDKLPQEVIKEELAIPPEKTQPKTRQAVKFTNLSKVFWPDEGYTKGDLISYYEDIAPLLLPYLKDRPESLLRYPNGITGKSFYQKDAGRLDAEWIETLTIFSESNKKDIPYLLCQDKETLLYLINLGCIDLNPWSSRQHSLNRPDYILIDLDPEATDFKAVVKTALAVRKILEKLDIVSYPKTSGAKGMHIYIPLGAKYTYEQSRQLAELLCIQVHHLVPDVTSLKRSPKDRQGLVYLDYLQNIEGQTLASVYSVRPQKGATVSTPVEWSEVTEKLHSSQFTMKNVQARIQKKGDLFKNVLGKGIVMEKVLDGLSHLLG